MSRYEVYLGDHGKRGEQVGDITSIVITFQYNKPSKFVIKGSGLTNCPIPDSSDIIVFRDGAVLLCGFTQSQKVKYEAKTRIYDWEVSGLSNIGKFSLRNITMLAIGREPTPDDAFLWTNYFSTVLLNIIEFSATAYAIAEKEIPGLIIQEQTPVGDIVAIESKLNNLLKFLQDKLVDTEFMLVESWNIVDGNWTVKIAEPEDVSDKVILSVDNGTLSSWERTITAPEANRVTVVGGKDQNDASMWTIAKDNESINKWGVIETVVNRTDIKRNEDADESWESVQTRLDNAASEELEKLTAQHSYKLTMAERSSVEYKRDYDIGSVVSVRIGNDSFTSKITEIKLTYKGSVETIEPSVGTIQKGELSSIFTEIGNLKEQIEVLKLSQ